MLSTPDFLPWKTSSYKLQSFLLKLNLFNMGNNFLIQYCLHTGQNDTLISDADSKVSIDRCMFDVIIFLYISSMCLKIGQLFSRHIVYGPVLTKIPTALSVLIFPLPRKQDPLTYVNAYVYDAAAIWTCLCLHDRKSLMLKGEVPSDSLRMVSLISTFDLWFQKASLSRTDGRCVKKTASLKPYSSHWLNPILDLLLSQSSALRVHQLHHLLN